MHRLSFLIFFILILVHSSAQELNGFWKGTLTLSPGGCFVIYNLELQIKSNGGQLTGVSYHYSDVTNYVKEDFDGAYNRDNKILSIKEIKVITFNVPGDCVPCIKKYDLTYSREGKKETLSGTMGGVMMNNAAACPPGKIVLTRIQESAFKEVEKKEEIAKNLVTRKNELVKEIKVDTGSIRLDFYDNGIIDGDTISVFVNNQPIVSSKGLTAKPVTVFIRIDFERTEQEVIMIGQNLGSIPPNTALMIVTAGTQRYQLYLTSTEQKNAMVRFVYAKPK